MNITIIGSGRVGTALAEGWLRAGHALTFGVRDPEKYSGNSLKISATDIGAAVKSADVIVISAIPQSVHEIASKMGDVSDKILIDTMNSVRVKPDPFRNTTEALASLTNCSHIVKSFNTTGAENMGNPKYGDLGIDMFQAGDSSKAKAIATQLALDLGFEGIYDFGGSDKFELLEQFALCWINMAIMQGYGRDFAFKVIKRP